jgi:hypothetical protein
MMQRVSALISLIALLCLSCFAQTGPQTVTPPTTGNGSGGNTQPLPSQRMLQDGTPVKLRLTQAVSSANAKTGDEISFEVINDIEVDGVTLVHRGAIVTAVVSDAASNKRMGRAGRLTFDIKYVQLTDGEKAPLRAVNHNKADSHTGQMVDLMINMPMAAAPFFLLMKGENVSFPKGTELNAWINGDVHFDPVKFGVTSEAQPADSAPAPSR